MVVLPSDTIREKYSIYKIGGIKKFWIDLEGIEEGFGPTAAEIDAIFSQSDVKEFMKNDGLNGAFNYLYRDAANYKVDKDIVFTGQFTIDQIKMIVKKLTCLDPFIPSLVGLKNLQPELAKFDTVGPNSDGFWNKELDHDGHEPKGIGFSEGKPTTFLTAEQFLANMVQ